jgi:hypothetical protein
MILMEYFVLSLDVQAIEGLLCGKGFSAAW